REETSRKEDGEGEEIHHRRKAPVEKKPKAGKKLPQDAASGEKKKKKAEKSVETYKIYIFKLVERALEESGDDLDSAIKRLNELRLGSGDNLGPVAGSSGATHESSSQGTVWVDLFVGEIKKAACGFQKENMMPKQQFEALIQENAILKRAVAIQHERQKEFEDRGNEFNQLKQLVAQYQEQLRTLGSITMLSRCTSSRLNKAITLFKGISTPMSFRELSKDFSYKTIESIFIDQKGIPVARRRSLLF
ncbi:hypothetical protein MTR67_018821, partial [Solanum verrucosum]